FYKVAYIQDEVFFIPKDHNEEKGYNERDTKQLNKLLKSLKEKIQMVSEDQKPDIAKMLNKITYLFKSVEYQHENEVRLVVEGQGIDKIFDVNVSPPRVYIEVTEIA